MNVSKITIGRLYNLGNYEHIRYEVSLDLNDEDDATKALVGLEKVISGLAPFKGIKSKDELTRLRGEIERMKLMPLVEWERQYGHCVGKPSEVIARYEKSLEEETFKSANAMDRATMARHQLNDIGGASVWNDPKLDWEED